MSEATETKPKKRKLVIQGDGAPESVERTAGSGEKVDADDIEMAPSDIKNLLKGPKRVERTDAVAPSFTDELKAAIGSNPDGAGNEAALVKFPTPAKQIAYFPLKALRESPTNPRKTYAKMEQLIASVKSGGLLVPLIVRPAAEGMVAYEIVAGHRRFRAAKEAGLKEVPCDVRELTNAQVTEIQITENLQRSDLTDLEEAETYETMRDVHHYSVDQIATKIGVSKATVYSRLKLMSLCPEARKALADGLLPPSVAVPLARLPTHKLQASALKTMKERWAFEGADGVKETIGVREAVQFLQREFCRSLKGASFSLKDETLVPEAGACSACPKNTANGKPGLFDDLKGAGQTCTDVGCFESKAKAAWKRTAEKEEKRGAKVLPIDEGAKLYAYGQLGYQGKYVELESKNHADPKKRTWGELLELIPPEQAPTRIVAPDKGLEPHALVDREALVKALAEVKGFKWAETEVERSSDLKEEKAEDREKRQGAEAREEAMGIAVAKAASAYAKDVKDDPVWRLMAIGLTASFAGAEVLKALGWEDTDRITSGKATVAECVRFVIVKSVLSDRDADYSEGYPESLKRWTRTMGADVGAIFDAQAAADEAEKLMKGSKKGKA
jgi:ParB/RepB/Spo0J family partition protein